MRSVKAFRGVGGRAPKRGCRPPPARRVPEVGGERGLEYGCTGSGFSTEANARRRFSTTYLQGASFVLVDRSEDLRKPPGVFGKSCTPVPS